MLELVLVWQIFTLLVVVRAAHLVLRELADIRRAIETQRCVCLIHRHNTHGEPGRK